jgi:hypothetical protein
VLCSYLPADVIVHIHSLLLLEKSLVVLGSDAALLSVVCTAFLHLLAPFTWAGIFVPLLPPLAQEILDAPVPFLVGYNAPQLFRRTATYRPAMANDSASILYLDDFVHYPRLYMGALEKSAFAEEHLPTTNASPVPPGKNAFHRNVFNINAFRHSINEVDDLLHDYVDAPSLRHFEPCLPLPRGGAEAMQAADPRTGCWLARDLSQRVEYLSTRYRLRLQQRYPHRGQRRRAVSSCGDSSWVQALLFDDDTQLYHPIQQILLAFHALNTSYTGSLLRTTYAWQDLATVHLASGCVEIVAERVVRPLHARMVYQEQFASTQMFALLVDRCYLHDRQVVAPCR